MSLEDLCDSQYDAMAYWLNRVDEHWQVFLLNKLTDAETQGAFACVYSGAVQMQARFIFWLKSIADQSTERTLITEAKISGWWGPSDILEEVSRSFGPSPIGFEWTGQQDQSIPTEFRVSAEFKRHISEWRNSPEAKRKLLVLDLRTIGASRRKNSTKPSIGLRTISDEVVQRHQSLFASEESQRKNEIAGCEAAVIGSQNESAHLTSIQELPASEINWSIGRSPADWLKVLSKLGFNMSDETFRKRRKSGTYRARRQKGICEIEIDKSTLPPKYNDEMTV